MATSDRFSSLALPLDYPKKCDRFQTGTGIVTALAPMKLSYKHLTVASYCLLLPVA
jgi:hypothetical protein